ncbi:MAG TPA: C25 family cysteine peptidase, partial [Actinomycetota bacterium]|nr:C25 family cysteine peptidase [Actinomycetota bacterium]
LLVATLEGVLAGDATVPPLEPGDEPVPVEVPIPIGPEVEGPVDFVLTVDPFDEIEEYDEVENNSLTEPVEIPPFEFPTTETSPPTSEPTEPPTTRREPPTTRDEETVSPVDVDIPTGVWVVGAVVLGALLLFGLARLAVRRKVRPPPREEPEAEPPEEAEAVEEAEAEGVARPRPPVRRPPRTVSTGFSSPEDPGRPFAPDTTIAAGSRTYFWLEVGAPAPGSIEVRPTDLPTEHLPRAARLDVTLSPLGGRSRIRIEDGLGELVLRPSGEVEVGRRPDLGAGGLPPPPDLARRRLFFDATMPAVAGTYRMRCGIYHRQTLVQSRLVTVVVTDRPVSRPDALRSDVDYTLSASLAPEHLDELPPLRVSFMLNRSDEDTHDLLVLGEGGVRMDLPLDAQELQNLIRIARAGLRLASWASEDEWDLTRGYRYQEPSRDRLQLDLASMAVRGAVLYAKILEVAVAHAGRSAVDRLQELLRRPGPVQVALGRSARRVFPAALVYDFLGIDTTMPIDRFELCDAFVEALDSGLPLEASTCFTVGCDTPGRRDRVCPSGFWGLRHELGLPVSELEADARASIEVEGVPAITIGVSTDARLAIRPTHEQTLRALWGQGEWNYADTREETIRAFKEHGAHVVYLYCHGGVTQLEEPYVQVGPLNEPAITAAVLANERVFWDVVRPLVFINGCHTTALEPEKAFELVSPLVALHGAVGVIGTEITIFEPLARDFAEACFRRFLEGATIGAAVRGARLDLLARGNPLGLVYIPFVLPGLRLHRG